ncbi:MAG: hypothetical protein WC282_04535, partial [Bacilli bacterium]
MKNIKTRLLITHILFWVAMIFMAYFAENVVVFDFNDFQRGFTAVEYILLFIGIIAILSYFFYCEHKYNGLSVKWILLSILILIVIGAAIGIFSTPEIQTFKAVEIVDEVETIVTKEFVTTMDQKIKSLFYVLLAAVGVYIQVIVLPRLITFRKYIIFLFYIAVGVAVISVFLSYVLDYSSYVHLAKYGLVGYIFPVSFLFNRNMYALMILIGMLAMYNIISTLPKWWNYLILIFLLVNLFFTFSKASVGIASITFVVHFIYRMVVTFKKHKIRNSVFLGIVGLLGICVIFLIPFPFFMDIKLFSTARNFIYDYYVKLGIDSYGSRSQIWESVGTISQGIHLWFGRGLWIFNDTLLFYTGEVANHRPEYFSHNGFVEILGQWGLIGLIPYCLGILGLIVLIFYAAIKDYKVGIPALIVFGAFLGYTMVETSTLFDLTIEGIATTVIVTLPTLSWLNAKRHPEINRQIVLAAENLEYHMPKTDGAKFERQATMWTALLLGLGLIFAFFFLKSISAQMAVYIMSSL